MKSIKKVLSIVLSVAMVFSVCVFSINVNANVSTGENNYYVINGGTGNGKTVDTPAGSVADAITAINADNLTTDDTATIHIMQRDDWNTDTTAGNAHKITYWGADGTVPAHEAKIIVQAYNTQTTTYLAFAEKAGQRVSMTMNGPTEFKNIVITATAGINTFSIMTNDCDVTFGAGVSYGYMPEYSAFNGTVTAKSSFPTGIGSSSTSTTENINLSFENGYYSYTNDSGRSFIYLGRVNSKRKYTGAYNISFDLASTSDVPRIHVGSTNSSNATVYDNDLNLNFKSANKFAFIRLSTYGSFTVNGALQIIKNKDAQLCKLPAISTAGKDITESYSFDDITVNGGKWILTNASGVKDIIEFTDTEGKYSVKEGYDVTAVKDDNSETVTSNDGTLQLTAGEWTINATKQPVERTYYVQNGGSGDGRTEKNPAATVKEVMNSVNADSTTGDTARIKIMRSTNRNKNIGNTVGGSGQSKPEHGYTAWSDDGSQTKHSVKIIVEAYDTTEPTYLAFNNKVGLNKNLAIQGPTEFRNITILSTRNIYQYIYNVGNSVTYGEGTSYACLPFDYSNATTKKWDGTINTVDALRTYAAESTTEVSDDVNIMFENEFASTNDDSAFYLNGKSYSGDVNITLNNAKVSPDIYIATIINKVEENTISGDLTVNVKNAAGLKFTKGEGKLSVGGALQVLLPSTTAFADSSDITKMDNVVATGGKWVVKINSDIENALSLTETAGTYKVAEGYTAITENANGEEIKSENGVLTLPAGNMYEVNIVNEYFNDGEKIKVYKDNVQINLANEKHKIIADKLFIGWANTNDTYVEQTGTYNTGDVLTAKYIDFSADMFKIEEVQIRDNENLGLRFIIMQNKSAVANIPNVSEFGTLTLPTDTAGGRDLLLDEGVTITWKWDATDVNSLSPDKTDAVAKKIVATNILEEDENEKRYTLCLTDIGDDYNTFYSARGYIKFTDKNGIASVVYTEGAQASAYQIAAEAVANGTVNETYNAIIKKVEEENASYKLSITETPVKEEKGVVFSTLSNGLNQRTMTIDSGIEGIEQMEIGLLADVHLNYINQRDVDEKVPNTLASYRGRTWLRDGSAVKSIINALEYSRKYFNTTVVAGDMVDYQSWGSLSLTNNLIARKSINNSILMTTGNHEFAEYCQPDIKGLPTTMTKETMYSKIQAVWSNNVYYHEQILKTAKGKENVMLVLLDNGNINYAEGTAEKLNTSITKAEEKNIPILLFQHIPMLTYNQDETTYYQSEGRALGFGTAEDNGGTVNMTNAGGYSGGGNPTDETKNTINLIRKNSDVIKAVFNGHSHCQMYTNIVALDENGNTLTKDGNTVYIPQHTVTATAYDFVNKIIIK